MINAKNAFSLKPMINPNTVTIQATEGSEPVWQKGRLVPDRDGMLVVGVPGALLPTGSYLLTVLGESDGQLVLDRHIPFETEPVR